MIPMRDRTVTRITAHNNRGQLLSGSSTGYATVRTCEANVGSWRTYTPCTKLMRYHDGYWHCPIHGEMSA